MTDELTANEAVEMGIRAGIQAALGDSGFDSDLRERYEVFGWPDIDNNFDAESYLALYLRNAYARTVVDKPAFTTWRDNPTIEGQESLTNAIDELVDDHTLWSHAERVDRAAGIGEHGVLIFGFDDVVGEMDNWETDARGSVSEITQVKPITQDQITDIEWGDPDSERWGQPEYYRIDWSEDIDSEASDERISNTRIHWTRVVDVPATRLLDDDTLARPRMEPVLNNIIDIEKTLGSAAEQSYRGADYGVHLNFDPEKVDPSSIDKDELRDEFQKWYHGLQPEFKTVGGEMERLGGEMQDPSSIIETNLDAISAQTGIPKKELRGNESGQVTGAEADTKSYFGMISERRTQYATPHIVRGIINRLQEIGLLPDVEYDVAWPDLAETSEQEQAEIESNRAGVVAQAGPIIGLTGEAGREYVESGEFPEAAEQPDLPEPDEENEQVQNQFFKSVGVEADD